MVAWTVVITLGPNFKSVINYKDAFEAPVLLVKTAWGGKSLYKDFKPPSPGGATGHYYTKMVEEVDEALNSAGTEFPTLKKSKARGIWFFLVSGLKRYV